MGLFDFNKRKKSAINKDRKYFNASEKHEVDYATTFKRKKKTYKTFDTGGGVNANSFSDRKKWVKSFLEGRDEEGVKAVIGNAWGDSDELQDMTKNDIISEAMKNEAKEIDKIFYGYYGYKDGGGVGELEIGNEVELQLNNGKTIKGKVEKINPLKIRTDATSTQVIPNSLIKEITKFNNGGGVGDLRMYDIVKFKGINGVYEGKVIGLDDKKATVKYHDENGKWFKTTRPFSDFTKISMYSNGGGVGDKERIKELDSELGRLEASYDADSDEDFRKEYLDSIRLINKELRTLGAEKYISEYENKYSNGGGVGEQKYAISVFLFKEGSTSEDEEGYAYISIPAKSSEDALHKFRKLVDKKGRGTKKTLESQTYFFDDPKMKNWKGFKTEYTFTGVEDEEPFLLDKAISKGSVYETGGGVGSFDDWWFNGGEETSDSKYGKLVTKALLKKQPSYPNEENAYSEALYELAKKDNAHKKYDTGGGVGDYYENLAVYVQGKGQIYQGTSMNEATEKANSYFKEHPKSEIAIVDEKNGDEYDLDGNLKELSLKNGGGIDKTHTKYPKFSYNYGGQLTDENMVRENLHNGEIHWDTLKEIIGDCELKYPYHYVGSIKLEKCFLKPYYRIVN